MARARKQVESSQSFRRMLEQCNMQMLQFSLIECQVRVPRGARYQHCVGGR